MRTLRLVVALAVLTTVLTPIIFEPPVQASHHRCGGRPNWKQGERREWIRRARRVAKMTKRQARRASACRNAVKRIPVKRIAKTRSDDPYRSPQNHDGEHPKRGCRRASFPVRWRNYLGWMLWEARLVKRWCWNPKRKRPNKGLPVVRKGSTRAWMNISIKGIGQAVWSYKGIGAHTDYHHWVRGPYIWGYRGRAHFTMRQPMFEACIAFRSIGCLRVVTPRVIMQSYPRGYYTSDWKR